MIPLGDDLPTLRTPVMTYFLIAVNFAVWIFIQGAGLNPTQLASTVCNLGMVPGELTHLAPLGQSVPIGQGLACLIDNDPINQFTPLIAMFLHGGWMHILGNMIYLAVFGRNIEDSMGRIRFLFFYLICGLIAAGTHIAFNRASPVPTVGASGAISGVLGAFLLLYPAVPVRMFVFIIRSSCARLAGSGLLVSVAGSQWRFTAQSAAAGRDQRDRRLGTRRRVSGRTRSRPGFRQSDVARGPVSTPSRIGATRGCPGVRSAVGATPYAAIWVRGRPVHGSFAALKAAHGAR